jgi:hypothetical protein
MPGVGLQRLLQRFRTVYPTSVVPQYIGLVGIGQRSLQLRGAGAHRETA